MGTKAKWPLGSLTCPGGVTGMMLPLSSGSGGGVPGGVSPPKS